MNTYTFTQARQNLASILDQASQEGEVRIKRRDGQVYIIRPQPRSGSPLDVKGLDLGISLDDILQAIQEGRKSY